jgi:hypothetical protein
MWDNVTLHNAEGRHFVGATNKKYDVISMNAVDTLTALNSGAYVLSENYLYTVEAIEQYLNALTEHGTMLICRWMFNPPREALRLANLFLYGAEHLRIKNPSQCIMVFSFYNDPTSWAATLIKKEPFTANEVETILNRIHGKPDLQAIYIPDIYPAKKQQEIEAKAFFSDNYDIVNYLKPARNAYYGLIRAESLQIRKTFENEYLYNITPVYDDRPFFFEYHKIAEIFSEKKISSFVSRGTIVHYVLFFLLGLTAFVSFISMILPLYIFEKEGLKVDRIWTLLGFFSCLGIGFMFLELGFIQKLSLYLGHPMYTLAVVLVGILMFTGIGSYFAGTREIDRLALLKQGMMGTALLSALWLLIINWIIPRTLGASLLIRILVSLCSIFPIGIFMGIPFATGIRYLEERYSRFIPWAWGINGLTSVMGSVLAIIIAMRVGFTIVVLLGCVIYLFGLFAIMYHLRSNLMPLKEYEHHDLKLNKS